MEPTLGHTLALDPLHSHILNLGGCFHPPPYNILWSLILGILGMILFRVLPTCSFFLLPCPNLGHEPKISVVTNGGLLFFRIFFKTITIDFHN